MALSIKGSFAANSDRGLVRLHNEDKAAVLFNQKGDLLFVVCDGLGGHNKGDFASKLAIDMLMTAFATNKGFYTIHGIRRWFSKQVKIINRAIFGESMLSKDMNNMSTTLNAVILTKRLLVNINIGDSRFYLINQNEVRQISEDQTVINYLLKTRQISEEDALNHPKRHVLTNALGSTPSISFTLKKVRYKGEIILLCTDGLYNMLDEYDLLNVLHTKKTTEQKVNDLIALANYRGGADNIGVCLFEVDND